MGRPRPKINEKRPGVKQHRSVDKRLVENQAQLKKMEQELSLENDALNYINQLSEEQEIRRAELRELMTTNTPAWNNREAIDAKMKEIISIEGSLRTARDYYSLYNKDVPELSPVEEEKTGAKQEKAESKEYALYTLEDEERLMQQEAEEARIKAEIAGLPKTPSIDEFSQEDDFTKEERQALTDARYGQLFEKYENGTLNNEEYQEFVSLQESIMSDLNPNYKNEPAKEEVKETNEASEATIQPQGQVKVEEGKEEVKEEQIEAVQEDVNDLPFPKEKFDKDRYLDFYNRYYSGERLSSIEGEYVRETEKWLKDQGYIVQDNKVMTFEKAYETFNKDRFVELSKSRRERKLTEEENDEFYVLDRNTRNLGFEFNPRNDQGIVSIKGSYAYQREQQEEKEERKRFNDQIKINGKTFDVDRYEELKSLPVDKITREQKEELNAMDGELNDSFYAVRNGLLVTHASLDEKFDKDIYKKCKEAVINRSNMPLDPEEYYNLSQDAKVLGYQYDEELKTVVGTPKYKEHQEKVKEEQIQVEEKDEDLEMPPISQEELDGLLGKTDLEESKSETEYDIGDSLPELEDEDTNDLGQGIAESPLEELPTVDASDYDEEIEGVGNPENLGVETEEETETYAPPEMEDEAEGVHFDPDESLNVAPQSFEEEQSQENEEEESGKGFLGAMKGAAKTVGAGFATVGHGIATGVKTVGGGIAKGTKFVGREALNVLGKDRGERIRNALILGGLAYVAYKQYQNGNAISNLTGVTKDGFADVKSGMSNLSAKVQAGTRQVMAQALRNKEAVLKVADQVTSLESITKENGSKLDGLGKQVSRNSRALGRIEPKVNDVYGYVQGQKELDKKILEEMLRNSRQAGDLVAGGGR